MVASMCIGPKGDRVRVSTLECARRMIRAKADVIGLNCLFDPFQTLEAMKDFKKAVDEIPPGQKKPHLMTQPNGYFTQDSGRVGWLHTDEFPFGRPTLPPKNNAHAFIATYLQRWNRDTSHGGMQPSMHVKRMTWASDLLEGVVALKLITSGLWLKN